MSWLEKLFESLTVDEEEVALKQMWEWYGPFIHWGLVFPRYKPENLILTLVLWFLYITMFWIHFGLLGWSIILELETLELWGVLFHFELILAFGILAVIIFNTQRQQVAECHRRAFGDMGSYPGGRIYSEKEPMRLKKKVDRETVVFMVMPVLTGVVTGFVLLVPYIARLGNDESYTKNGVNLKLFVPLYYPFPTHEGILRLVALGLQLTAASLLTCVLVAVLIAVIMFGQRVKYEYQVLNYALETLFRRADEVYSIDHPGEPKIQASDPLYQKYVGQILRQCIIHHLEIVEFSGSFHDAMVKWPTAFAYPISIGSIGISLFTILSALKSKSYQDLVVFSLAGLVEVINMFLLSVLGETITTESENLRDHLYYIDWYDLDLQNRKILLNFQVGTTKPQILKAGGLVDISFNSYTTIINYSYSFFNLMLGS